MTEPVTLRGIETFGGPIDRTGADECHRALAITTHRHHRGDIR
jgi:hypothetical protein